MTQYFTAEGLNKLKEELKYLKTVKTKEIADLLRYAASFGDLKENAGYDDAKDRQSWLLRRISELEGIINSAIIHEKVQTDKIQIGSEVLILFGGKQEKFYIVTPGESDVLKNKISYQSPLGQKLIGQKVGKEFYFKGGAEKIKVKILEIH